MGRAQGKSPSGFTGRQGTRAAVSGARVSRAWRQGQIALVKGQTAEAAKRFESALADDPECADALLGLYAAGRILPDHLERLLGCSERLGELQSRHRSKLSSSTTPAGFQHHRLQTSDDVLRARAGELLDEGSVKRAIVTLARANPRSFATVVMKARAALAVGEADTCVRLAQKVRAKPGFSADANLLLGCAYADLGLRDAALSSFAQAEQLAENPEGALAARYNRADSLERMGERDRARSEFESLYHDNAAYADVAKRLGVVKEPDLDEQPPRPRGTLSDTELWDSLTQAFSEGPPAPEPKAQDKRRGS